jgi:transcriptional coactivator HFI1/ADA1
MNPADLSITISPTLTTKALATPSTALNKNGKIPVPRVDLEPIYVQLKAVLGDQWADYKAAVNAFTLGMCPYCNLMAECR